MAITKLTEQQIEALNHMCISAEKVEMGTLLQTIIKMLNSEDTDEDTGETMEAEWEKMK